MHMYIVSSDHFRQNMYLPFLNKITGKNLNSDCDTAQFTECLPSVQENLASAASEQTGCGGAHCKPSPRG